MPSVSSVVESVSGMRIYGINPVLEGLRALAILGDMVTTDHLSPNNTIASDSVAARYLQNNRTASPATVTDTTR